MVCSKPINHKQLKCEQNIGKDLSNQLGVRNYY